MNRIIYTIAISILLYSCSINKSMNVIFYEDVEQGKNLDLAKQKSVNWFLTHRSQNTEKNRKWILANNTKKDYVFYGKLSDDKNNGLRLDELYKVSRKKLEKNFPKYLSLDGVALDGIMFTEHVNPFIKEKFTSVCPNRYTIEYKEKYYQLKNKGILAIVKIEGFCFNKSPDNYTLKVLLDKNNLKELSKSIY